MAPWHNQHRCVITASVEPPPFVDGNPGYYERPGSVILAESALVIPKNSWCEHFATAFPLQGMHFVNVDLFASLATRSEKVKTMMHLSRLEEELSSDIAQIPGVTLVARGPIPCLVAQYYLESLPLSGLVLVDPIIIPDYESMGDSVGQLRRTAQKTAEILSASVAVDGRGDGSTNMPQSTQTETEKDGASVEWRIISELANGEKEETWNRPLRLEPGSVPTLVLHSEMDEGTFQTAAETTAKFHSLDEDAGSSWGDMQVKRIDQEVSDEIVHTIFTWIDDNVQ